MKKIFVYILVYLILITLYAVLDYFTKGLISTGACQYISIVVVISLGVLAVQYINDKIDR